LGIQKRLRCSTRADKLTDQVASILKRSGFDEVCLGVESGDQIILNRIGKRTTIAANTLAMKTCRHHGLKSKAFIMIGLPGETHETIKATHKWIETAKPDKISVYMFNPLPGCDIYDNQHKYDIGFTRGEFSTRYYGGDRNSITSKVFTRALSANSITQWYRKFLVDFHDIMS
jgi:radical SAM superfamily enzyme YgiQ (UPF0313 family)